MEARFSTLDRCLALRDRLLASTRFQRLAAAFPLTRPIARHRARALFDICAGFVYSQVLFACVRLRLFDILAEGPQTTAGLARRLGLSEDVTARLLGAAASLRLAERRGIDRYGLGPLGAALTGNRGIVAMIEHHPLLYSDLGDPVALLRGERRDTELSRYWPYADDRSPAGLAEERIAAYTALMAASQPLISGEVLGAYSLRKHRCLLDVGGGDGSFLIAAAARAPGLRLVLFDLPSVAASARARFAAEGLADRAIAVGGDFLSGQLPSGADVISLIRVIHDHDDEAALAILRAVHRALPENGTLLLAEPMSGTAGAEPIGDAYFGFYLLAMGRGRPRAPDAIERLLLRAGFGRIRLVATRTPMLTRLMLAYPSPAADTKT